MLSFKINTGTGRLSQRTKKIKEVPNINLSLFLILTFAHFFPTMNKCFGYIRTHLKRRRPLYCLAREIFCGFLNTKNFITVWRLVCVCVCVYDVHVLYLNHFFSISFHIFVLLSFLNFSTCASNKFYLTHVSIIFCTLCILFV